MNKLNFLGRGSGYNVTEGNTSGFIIRSHALLLVDCGESIFKRIVETNLTENIKEIYILKIKIN